MPFRIANAPTSFQNMINEIVKDMIVLGIIAISMTYSLTARHKKNIRSSSKRYSVTSNSGT
jgi:hypothetical protein